MDIHSSFVWWESAVRAAFHAYSQASRPILDVVQSFFEYAFNVLLVITFFVSVLYLVMTFYTAVRRKSDGEKIDQSYTPSVTIQIPTFNELVAIRCARACLAFDYPKDRYEIIIGDDSSMPEVSKQLSAFAAGHPQVKVVRRERNTGYKPGNLNNMLPHSKGEFIVIFDSDFVPKQDFLKRIVQPFKDDRKVAAVQAKWTFLNARENMITVLGSSILNVYHYITLPFLKGRRKMSLLCGSAEAVRKSTLVQLGAWDTGNLTEDIEYSIRLINSGYRIIYLEDLTCDSEVPHTSFDLYRQQMRWGYGVIHSYKKHFRAIYTGKGTSFWDKVGVSIVCSGYLLSFLLFALLATGTLSLVTHAPAPVEWGKLLSETARNIALTSGLLVANIVALRRSRNMGSFWKMIASSFSYGIVMTYHVNKGILKAIFGRPMEWFMLTKRGNETYNQAPS